MLFSVIFIASTHSFIYIFPIFFLSPLLLICLLFYIQYIPWSKHFSSLLIRSGHLTFHLILIAATFACFHLFVFSFFKSLNVLFCFSLFNPDWWILGFDLFLFHRCVIKATQTLCRLNIVLSSYFFFSFLRVRPLANCLGARERLFSTAVRCWLCEKR